MLHDLRCHRSRPFRADAVFRSSVTRNTWPVVAAISPLLVVVVLVVFAGMWQSEVKALKAQIEILKTDNADLTYALKSNASKQFVITSLSASDTTPNINQDIVLSYKVRELFPNNNWDRYQAALGYFTIDTEICKEYLRLDDPQYGYDRSQTIRVVDMPTEDTNCTVSLTLRLAQSGSDNYPVLDKRSIVIGL